MEKDIDVEFVQALENMISKANFDQVCGIYLVEPQDMKRVKTAWSRLKQKYQDKFRKAS